LPDRSNHRQRARCPNYVRIDSKNPNARRVISGGRGPDFRFDPQNGHDSAIFPAHDPETVNFGRVVGPTPNFYGSLAENHCGRCKSDADLQNFDHFRLAKPQTQLLRSKRDRIWGPKPISPNCGLDLNIDSHDFSLGMRFDMNVIDVFSSILGRDSGFSLRRSPDPIWGGTSFMTLELATFALSLGLYT
jgi:hypothetical protein